MPTSQPIDIPFPLSSFPGAKPQESAGRLINCYAEVLGDPSDGSKGAPKRNVWRRSAGLSRWNNGATGQTGYRGGLIVAGLSYETWSGNASTVDDNGNYSSLGTFPGTQGVSIAHNQSSGPDIVAVDVGNGAYVLGATTVTPATGTATIGGSVFDNGDTVAITFANINVSSFPVTVTYTLGAGESATSIATGLKNLINGNGTLSAANVSATSAAGVITIDHQGQLGNTTILSDTITGSGNETVTFSNSGDLTGGAGVVGAFTGVPTFYNGQGNLPQPNSVCFQDGYLFFTIANGQCYATQINSLLLNPLTEIKVQAKSDVTLLRGIAYSGLLFLFTTGSCEVWQDVANAAPNFPYARQVVLEYGLVQSNAIAGFETGFSELCWVAQDFGVYWMTPGSLAPIKISPADLDRLIETQVNADQAAGTSSLRAGCYIIQGKKFWTLSNGSWTWAFNHSNKKWYEGESLNATLGYQSQWRGVGGHPAFGKWLMGDAQSGNLLFADDANFTDDGAPILFRMESGLCGAFPNRIVARRADFEFVTGVGQVTRAVQTVVTGAAMGVGGAVELTVADTAQMSTNDTVIVTGVTGTTEANGTWPVTVIDGLHVLLQGSQFANAWVSGGTVTDITAPANVVAPSVAISWSDDNGGSWSNPLIRSLGGQKQSKTTRVSVKNTGQTGPDGRRWRVDVTDPVYVGLLGGSMSSDPREH